jgi:hypothetical protein
MPKLVVNAHGADMQKAINICTRQIAEDVFVMRYSSVNLLKVL